MKSYLTLASKELKAQKITAVLILIAVIMSTIMTTVIGQSIGTLQSMRIQQAAGLNGNRYVTFHQLSREQAQKLHEDDRLYDVGDIIFIGSTPLGNSSLTLYLREYHDNALAMYPAISEIKEGRLPEKANEVALSEDKIDDARFARMSKRYEQEQGEIGAKVKALRLELKKAEGQQMDMEDFLRMVRRYTHVTKITQRMVAELIDHIDVYHAEKQDGVTNQHVVIHYNCIGAFDVPDRKKIPEADIIMETRKGVALSYAPAEVAV